MRARQFKLILEVYPGRVFYSLDYDPPLRNLGGYLGRVHPGGSLFNLNYEYMAALGTGTHVVQVDEKVCDGRGTPVGMTPDEQLVESVRFAVFMERLTGGTLSNTTCSAIMAFNSRTGPDIVKLLNEEQLQDLAEFAHNARNDVGNGERPSIVSSSGEAVIPEENLQSLINYFAKESS